jgi:hypothetical protein
VDIDGRHFGNWYRLLIPPRLRHERRFAVVFLDAGAPVKVVIRGQGAIPLDRVPFTGTDRPALARLARELDVVGMLVVEREVLVEIARSVERELHIADDFVAQALVFVREVERRRGAGIWSEPPLLELLPPVAYDPLQRTFDALIADRSSMLAYVFEDDGSDIHASAIAVKRRGHIDLVTTHQSLEREIRTSRLAHGWRREYRGLLKAVERCHEKPSLAIFLQRSAWQRIALGPPDQLGRELNQRNVILDPAPAWLLGLLGSATMAAVAGRGAKALARMLPRQARLLAAELATTAQSVIRDSGAHPFALLGFDPIELWHRMRELYRPLDE